MRNASFALTLSLLLLTGCSGSLQQLRDRKPEANDFASSLASEYLAYADSESEQGRSSSARHYADKGLKALDGQVVEPESPDRSLTPAQREQLADARAALMALETDDIKRLAPQKLARAQLLFDCWQHQLDKDLNQQTAPCAEEFKASMADLQDVADNLNFSQEKSYRVAFAPGSSHLRAGGKALIATIAGSVKDKAHYRVEIDALSGPKPAQGNLTDARLVALRAALLDAGIEPGHVRSRKESGKAVVLSEDKNAGDRTHLCVTVKTDAPAKDAPNEVL